MAFLQKKRHEADFGRKVRCSRNAKFAIQCFMISAFDWKTLNFSSRVQSYIDGGLDKDLVDPEIGENIAGKRRNLGINTSDAAAVSDEFMFPPPTALWKGSPMVEQFYRNLRLRIWWTTLLHEKYVMEKSLAILNMLTIISSSMSLLSSICCFGEHIWNILLFLDLDRFTVFRGLPEFFLLNEAKLSWNRPWL